MCNIEAKTIVDVDVENESIIKAKKKPTAVMPHLLNYNV
jgi:hypothetical protein